MLPLWQNDIPVPEVKASGTNLEEEYHADKGSADPGAPDRALGGSARY
jgi:hypothetical protein